MTNTTKVPATTSGIRCGNCSTFQAPVYHASIAAVRLCYEAKYAPAPVAPPAPAPAPKAKKFSRYSAACPKKGCKTHAVKPDYFVLKCSNHGKAVYTPAKQLEGTVSMSAKHKCDPRCTGAKGHVCVCACGGVNHGLDLLVTLG